MSDQNKITNDELTNLTADIVSAYVTNNTIPSAELPSLIASVFDAMTQINSATPSLQKEQTPQKPAVPVKKSIKDDYIICLEDGKKFKSLKRHLRAHYNLSPEEYRTKWGLPPDYPMVAPAYAKRRSELAKKLGLGNSRAKRS